MGLLPVEESLARILDGVVPLGMEHAGLLEARGRVLGSDLAAKLTQPPFDASAMDGYAVRSADVTRLPATLRVVGESIAGRGFAGSVAAGQAVRIFTGAPIPLGADAIVIQENVDREGDRVVVSEGACDPAHIRKRGCDFHEGARILSAGRVLDARALTLAAAAGHASLPVRRRPKVAILATGNELVPPGATPGLDQIISSNPIGIAALVAASGGEPRILGIAGDEAAAIAAKLAEGQDADILVTIGGVSVGDHDLVAPALKARAVELDFWKIAMRPGKPMLFGRSGAQRILGLPGNPVSCLICARVFLVPLIHKLLGQADTASSQTAILATPIEANGPRRHYMRATFVSTGEGRPRVKAVASQDSSLLSPLASADCLIVRQANAPAARAGAEVDILRFDF